MLLEPSAAQAIATMLHELATNAAKYGALSVANGQVKLTWTHEADGSLHMRWTEIGGPAVQEPTHEGFGRKILQGMISQLGGTCIFDWCPEGLVCELSFRVV